MCKELATTVEAPITFQMGNIETFLGNNGTVWFRMSDIAKVLGVDGGTATKWKEWADKDEIDLRNSQTGGKPIPYCSDSMLYRILNRSNSPKAKPFERWVTKEVLPSVRKHGMYATENVVEQMLKDPASFITLLQNYQAEQQERKRLAKENTQLAYEKESLLADNMYLNDQLGYGKTWKQIKGIKWLGKYFNLKDTPIWSILGKVFTALSTDLGYNIETTPSSENGTVNLYHVDVVDYFEKLLETRDSDVDNYIKNPRWFNPNYRTC